MNRNILFRFFEGSASKEEERDIRHWLNESEANMSVYLQERKIYDALLLNSIDSLNSERKPFKFSFWSVSAIASMLLLLIISVIYLNNQIIENNKHTQYNTIIVPPGQRINLILADNTNVWLNSNTEFRYPTKFSNRERLVYLDGEAFFKVNKNKERNFIVKTHSGDIKVTGTSFNLEAYSSHKSFETSLFEGSVEVYKDEKKLAVLKPNEKIHLENGKLYISKITDTSEFLWKDGLIAFNNEPLEDILNKLEKYFDINIEINSKEIPDNTYTGKFRQSDGIDYALRVLKKSIHFKYERDEETQTININ